MAVSSSAFFCSAEDAILSAKVLGERGRSPLSAFVAFCPALSSDSFALLAFCLAFSSTFIADAARASGVIVYVLGVASTAAGRSSFFATRPTAAFL